MRIHAFIGNMLTSVLVALSSINVGTAARAADYYQGKTLTVIVGYAPGGGVAATARVITRHLGRFIPGRPNVVVQNMEGAAGIVSVNHLERRVAPDGLTLAVPGRSWYIEAIVKRPGITFDPVKLTYIGSPGAVSAAAFIRASTGIRTLDELKASPKTFTFGALGSTTPTAMAPALLACERRADQGRARLCLDGARAARARTGRDRRLLYRRQRACQPRRLVQQGGTDRANGKFAAGRS